MQTLCGKCQETQRLRLHYFRWMTLLFVSLLLFSEGFLIPVKDPVFWFLANYLLVIWWAAVCIPLHELGHAIAGRFIGWEISRIVLGRGRKIASFRFLGFRWECHLLLGGGVTLSNPVQNKITRWRYAIFVAAGPGVNLALAALTIPLIASGWPWEIGPLCRGFEPIRTLFWANILSFLVVIRPKTFLSVTGSRIESDGLKLWRLLTKPADKLNQLQAKVLIREINLKLKSDQKESARQLINQVLLLTPENKVVQTKRDLLALECGDLDAARTGFLEFLKRTDLTNIEKAFALNNLAYLYSVLGDPDLLTQADELSLQALAELPDDAHMISTRGAVLISLGRCVEGEKLIRETEKEDLDPSANAENCCWLAFSAAQQNRLGEAQDFLDKARQHDALCFLTSRIEARIAKLTANSKAEVS